MNNFLKEFNRETKDKYNYLRVHSAEIHISNSSIDIVMLIPYDKHGILNEIEKQEILKAACSIIPKPFRPNISYKKSFADVKFILRDILDFINIKFPALNAAIKQSHINVSLINDIIFIEFDVENSAYNYLKNSKAEDKLKDFMSTRYCNSIEFSYKVREDSLIETKEDIEESEPSYINVSNLKRLIGREISSMPNYIRDIVREVSKVAVAGKITSATKNYKKNSSDIYYIFNLDDTTGSIRALYFPKVWNMGSPSDEAGDKALSDYKLKIDTLDKLIDQSAMGNLTIILEGSTKFDNNNNITLFINNLSQCDIDFDSIKSNVVKNPIPTQYKLIFPKPYIDTVINSSHLIPNYLKNKRIVVFDFETTGIDPIKDTPIELGAVSIVNGELSEQFSTYINPGCEISEEITRLTHISNMDVVNAPTIVDVIPDFYKFCDKAVLVAHNMDFDYAFLKNNSFDEGYIFDNERQDTLAMSKVLLKGLEKHSLEYLCRYFNIVNEGAHRAIFDAIATARLYMLLLEKI